MNEDERPGDDDEPLVKVLLHNQGEDSETVWAFDLGPTESGHRVRLDNVPFLHSKPTFGDELVVMRDEHGLLAWDRRGVPWERIDERILVDGGRYAMIVDYAPREEAESPTVFATLSGTARGIDVVPEGFSGPRNGRPGRMYLAVREGTTPQTVFDALVVAATDTELTLVHPA